MSAKTPRLATGGIGQSNQPVILSHSYRQAISKWAETEGASLVVIPAQAGIQGV
jgi:hypothetical protein